MKTMQLHVNFDKKLFFPFTFYNYLYMDLRRIEML